MVAEAVEVRGRVRVGWVDRARGLAVLLMVVDHVLVQVAPQHWLRYTLTRLSLPLFCVAAAAVSREGRWAAAAPSARRLLQLAGAVVAEALLLRALGMPTPGPVMLLAALALVGPWLPRRWAGSLLVVGLCQALWLPFPWSGYQPGLVAAYWFLGHLAAGEVEPWAARLPGWVGAVGRRPLGWYVGHLAVLVLLVGAGVL